MRMANPAVPRPCQIWYCSGIKITSLMQKLCCFVDESGQETSGRIFVVTVIISGERYKQLMTLCETYERLSQKGRRKWHSADPKPRLDFIRLVIGDSRFEGVLCYSTFQNQVKPAFDAFTVDTLASVIASKLDKGHYVVEAWIDGLSKTKRTEYANSLRGKGLQNVHLHRVRKEDSNALIRLADSLAGLLRDAIDAKYPEAVQLAQRGQRNGIIVEV
jgi:Protein of unknown function (DUF3800)